MHTADQWIGAKKTVSKKEEKLVLIRPRAPFVAKSAGGVWEKQFHKSLELGNARPEGGGRPLSGSSANASRSTTMHICISANMQICTSANMQICKYANMQICKYICGTAWVKNECVSVHRLVFTCMHVHLCMSMCIQICACNSVSAQLGRSSIVSDVCPQ